MLEHKTRDPFGTEIEQTKYWDEYYKFLSISPALKILGIEHSDYESLRRIGFFTPHIGYGPTKGNQGGTKKIESTYIKPSEILRYAAIVFEKKNNPDCEWRELTFKVNGYILNYQTRLNLLQSKYWEKVKKRAKHRDINLDNYPSMNLRLIEAKCKK